LYGDGSSPKAKEEMRAASNRYHEEAIKLSDEKFVQDAMVEAFLMLPGYNGTIDAAKKCMSKDKSGL